MLNGKIATWNLERGFGFIECDDGGVDIFVHCSGLADRLRDHLPVGSRVSFDIARNDYTKKQQAINVTVLTGNAASASRDVAEQIFTHSGRI